MCELLFIKVEYVAPIYDGTVPFTAGGREGIHGFDFSNEHLSALHKVPQLKDLEEGDYAAVGVTISDRMFDNSRIVDLNVAFAMKIGRGDHEV